MKISGDKSPLSTLQCPLAHRFCRSCRLYALVLILPASVSALWAEPATEAVSSPKQQSPVRRLISDDWEVVYLQDARAGYGRTRVIEFLRAGQTLRQRDSSMRLQMRRFGQPVAVHVSIQTTEDPQGRLLDFRTEMEMGPSRIISSGRVIGEELKITTRTGEETTTSKLLWSDEDRGFFHAENSLREKPMRPGEKRSFTALVPVFNKIARTELIAGEYEQTQLLDGAKKLLPILSRTDLGGTIIDSKLWVDEAGRVLKTQEDALGQTVYRTTKAIALAGANEDVPDLIVGTVVPVEGDAKDLHAARAVRYRVRLKRSDPGQVFPNSETQKVTPKGNREIELVVSRSATDQDREAVADRPTKADRSPSRWIQSDDPQVVALATNVAGDAKDPVRIARALEQHVYNLIDKKDFSTALGSAAEVARTRRGDCTEHAVLLAALARVREIPARVVVGLVYVPSLGGFGYHMWAELWVQDRWLALDATRAVGGIGGGHLKIAHASLSDADGLMVFLPVLQVIGQMQIEVVEETGN